MLLIRKINTHYLRKLLIIVFLFGSLCAAGQNFSFTFKRTALSYIFTQIEQQSNFQFIYTEELLDKSLPVTFSAKNISIDSLLRLCFKQQPLDFIKEGQHIIIREKIIEKPAPPVRELRGRIINEEGDPAMGITIAIKNSNLITASDEQGEFVFVKAPVNVILQVSGVQINPQEFVVGSRNDVLVVVQKKITMLDETMVIAYGTTTKRASTGSIQKLSKEELSHQPVTNVLAGMEGRMTGVQISQSSGLPGSNFSIRIRGQNSIANGNEPLYIIDGVPFPSTSLTSTMGGGGGAKASPLSGINPEDIESIEVLKDADATAIYGSRGANGVVLITTKKARSAETKVEANFFTGWGRVTRLLPLLGLSDYLSMRREAFRNDGINPTNSNARDLLLWDTTRYTDWQKYLIGNTMHTTDVNIGISGGNQLTRLSLNGGYHKESTILPGDFGEEKKSLRFSMSHSSSDRRFQVGLSGSFMKNQTFLPRNEMASYITLPPNAPAIYTPDGKYNWENSTWTNPMALLEQKYNTNSGNLISNLNISYKFLDGLEARISLGYSSVHFNEHTSRPSISYDPGFSSITSAGFGNNQVETFIVEPQLSYRRGVKKARFEFLAGSTLQETDQEALVISGSGYQSDDLLGSIQSAAIIRITTDVKTKYKYAGIFARISFNWDNKYLLSLNGRRDGSSRYGPENRFANFGSVGTGWIFSREKFMASSKLLSYGKLKFSAGITGNDQIGEYKFLDSYNPYFLNYQGVSTLAPVQLYNPAYSWERVTKMEGGLELGFLNDKVLFTANYYNNLTTNQLVQYALPAITGFQGILKNLPARIRNYGWEFELNNTILKNKNFQLTADLHLTIPRNKLLAFENLASSSYANTYVIGMPLSISKRLTYTGVDKATGNYTFLDANNDGKISSPSDLSSVVFVGQQWYGGFESNLKYKRISAGFFAQFVRLRHTSTYVIQFSRPGAMVNQPVYVLERWQNEGQVTDLQKFTNSNSAANTAYTNYRRSDITLGDASYIRIKNIYCNYDLPGQVCNKVGMKTITAFVQMQNPITITNYKGLDPETKSLIPPLKMLTAGFRLTL